MKSSIYNTYIPLGKNEYVLFNTLSSSSLLIDGELKECMEKLDKGLMGLDDEILHNLKEQGVLVEEGIDERRIFEYKYLDRKYSNRDAQFSILLTYACNLSCPYCYEGRGEIKSKSMGKDVAGRVIQAIKRKVDETGCKNLAITFYGGEPLLNRKEGLGILEALSVWCARKNVNFKSALITNGTLITPDVVSTFSSYLSAVQLTLDGPRWYHDTKRVYKNGKGTYDRIMESITLLRKAGIFVFLRVQISKDNFEHMGELFEDLKSRGFDSDNGLSVYAFPLMELNPACCSYASFCVEDDSYPDILPRVWEEGLKRGFIMVSKPLPTFIQPFCSFANDCSYLVDAYGDVYKCISVVGQDDRRVARIGMGGIFTDVSYELVDFMARDPFKIDGCRKCVYMPTCSGGCAYRAYLKHRSYHAEDCTLHKPLEQKKVLFYLKYKYPEKFGGVPDEVLHL